MSAPSHAPNGLHDAAHQGATAHAPVALLDILDKLPSDEEAAAAMANPASSKFAASMESLRQEYRRMKRFLEETQKETGQLREADQLTIAKGYGALRAATAVGREKEPQLLPLDDEIEDERPARKKRKTSENTSIPSTSTAHTGETGRFKVTAVGRFSDVMNGKFTKQLVQALGATWYRGKRPLRSSRSRSKATNGTTMFTHPNPTGAFDFEIDWRTGKSSGGFYEEKNKRKPSVWGGARKLFKGSQRIFIAGYAGFCSDKPTMSECYTVETTRRRARTAHCSLLPFRSSLVAAVWALEDSDADVIYIRSNEHNEATCWVYHAPNLVEQLKDNAPRTGPLVADMETGDGARLLISMAKRLDEGCRYDMFRKVDAKGNVSFVPGEGGEGGEVSRMRVQFARAAHQCSPPRRLPSTTGQTSTLRTLRRSKTVRRAFTNALCCAPLTSRGLRTGQSHQRQHKLSHPGQAKQKHHRQREQGHRGQCEQQHQRHQECGHQP